MHNTDRDSGQLVAPVEASSTGARAVLVLPGELDLATAPEVLGDIRRCLAELPALMIIDVSGVRFLGAIGVHALLQAREQAERDDVRLHLIGLDGNRRVRRVLTIAGVIGLFDSSEPACGAGTARPPGVALMFEEGPGRRGSDDVARVTGGYYDEDTGRLQWVVVRPAGRGGHGREWLVPSCRVVVDDDRFLVALPTEAVWGAPAVSGAPEEIGDAIEDRLWRHYADTVNPTAAIWPMPDGRSVRRCYRIDDTDHVRNGLAQLISRRRMVDCRSVR